MKKNFLIIPLLILLIFQPKIVQALSSEEKLEKFNYEVIHALKENEWIQIENGDNYTLKVLIGNINTETIITVSLTFGDLFKDVDNASGGKKAYYTLTPCADGYSSCNKETDKDSVDESLEIKFQISSNDQNDNVYAITTDVTAEEIEAIKKGNNFFLSEVYGPWWDNSKLHGNLNGSEITKLIESGSEISLNMKCVYNLGANYRFILTYDCFEIKTSCEGDYLCDATSNIIEKNLEKSDGNFMCPSQVYYKVSYGDTITTRNRYTISNVSENNYEAAYLIADDSHVTSGQKACEHKQEEPTDENYVYDFTCNYGEYYLKFNKGDAYAVVSSTDPLYANVRRVNLEGNNTKCPEKTYTLCQEGACSITYSKDHLGLSGEHKLVEDNDEIKNADELEIYNQEYRKQNGFSPSELCKDEENCDINLNGFCGEPTVSRVLKFIGLIIFIAKILVPAIIIIMGFVTLFKIMTSGKVDEAKKQVNNIIRNIVIGVLIFLLPSLINLVFEMADDIISPGETSDFSNCVNCLTTPNDSSKCIIDESDD